MAWQLALFKGVTFLMPQLCLFSFSLLKGQGNSLKETRGLGGQFGKKKKKKLGYEMRDLLCFPGLAVFVL